MPVVDGWIPMDRDTQLCCWCGHRIVDGDEHGIVSDAADGGATVTCRVAMICQMPAHSWRITSE